MDDGDDPMMDIIREESLINKTEEENFNFLQEK